MTIIWVIFMTLWAVFLVLSRHYPRHYYGEGCLMMALASAGAAVGSAVTVLAIQYGVINGPL